MLEQLKVAGFRDVCISLGYMAPLFKAFFGDGSRIGLSIEYVLEDEPLGTAGALTLVPDLAENFLVLNGDTLTDLDFKAFLDVHVESGADATILTQKVDEYVDYGVLEFDGSGRLEKYIEKPTRNYFVSTGIYALSRSVVSRMKRGERLDMPNALRQIHQEGGFVRCYYQEGIYWRDIGRFDHYELASQDFQSDPGRFLGGPDRLRPAAQ